MGTKEGLERVLNAYKALLHEPDTGAFKCVLAAYVANHFPGDPVWLLIVAAASSGKTEALNPMTTLPSAIGASTLTEAGLLSGTAKKARTEDATGGLLCEIGPFGIIVLKDFGSVLSMSRDPRALVLAALRELYDGSWTRVLGTDGGRRLAWSGKVGLLAGCTGAIDSHHAVMAALGERFLTYRIPPGDAEAQARWALTTNSELPALRSAFRDAVRCFVEQLDHASAPVLPDHELAFLSKLAPFAARCRSAVERDSYSREIIMIPDPEAPGRLTRALSQLRAGLDLIGIGPVEARALVRKVALDGMPSVRRRVLDVLLVADAPLSLEDVAGVIGYPPTTTRRQLEDLEAHGVLCRKGCGQGVAARWSVSDWTRTQWHAIDGPA